MKGRPVVLRTLDLGADKALNGSGEQHTMPNPAMGLRAIRFCLAEPQMFLTQLRAILRASHYGKVRVLLPMLAHAHEIDQTLALIAQAKAQLDERGQPYDKAIQIGGMIEIPAAALALPIFMRRLDFLSIGTNDLIQYTLAIDRTDDSVAHLYDPLHPAVLTLVAGTIQTATRGGVPVAVCGEMAGDLQLTRLLLGLGCATSRCTRRSSCRSRSGSCAPTWPRCRRSRSACCARATRPRPASFSPNSTPKRFR